MKIVIGSDKSGFTLKEAVKAWLEENRFDVLDLGTQDMEHPQPFFRVAPAAAKAIQGGEAEMGILVCGTGMGMSQVAGKYEGIRAACVESLYGARMCRAINDSNILCMGGWIIAPELGIEMVRIFLETEFTEGLEEWRQKFLKNARREVAELERTIYHGRGD